MDDEALQHDPRIEQAARWIVSRGGAAALTGAGISVPSGIPDFRSASGLWARYDPFEYATIEAFRRDPEKVWTFLRELERTVQGAEPNPAHEALAQLEHAGWLDGVVTQNVDALHQRAGSRRVVELHGSGARLVCPRCGRVYDAAQAARLGDPPRCVCGAILKPDIVLFGEPLPPGVYERAVSLVEGAPVLLVVGTSAEVFPAAGLPERSRRRGGLIVEINPQPTALTERVASLHLPFGAEHALPALARAIEREAKGHGKRGSA